MIYKKLVKVINNGSPEVNCRIEILKPRTIVVELKLSCVLKEGYIQIKERRGNTKYIIITVIFGWLCQNINDYIR